MKKLMRKEVYLFGGLLLFVILGSVIFFGVRNNNSLKSHNITATVMAYDDELLTIQDSNNIIYTFKCNNIDASIGESILLEYSGLLDKNKEKQDGKIVNYNVTAVSKDENGIPDDWLDNGIFKDYYVLSKNKLDTLSLDEKIGQIFLVRYPANNGYEELKKYQFGGYVFFERDFTNKTKKQVKGMMNSLQSASSIPILIAVDEEGGNVVRVSSNPNIRSSKFKSPSELYNSGGFDLIRDDTLEKSQLLRELGINLNLAPVVDVSTNSSDYIYDRTLGQNTSLTATYAKTVINASKGTGVSYTLKHFPGYGNNQDTHTGSSIDNRSYDDIMNNDLPPFQEGIDVGAEAVLVSHNIVNSIDSNNPASLSPSVHNLLRNNLNFTGISITDDLDMGAVNSIDDRVVKAILAGNDMLIVTDYVSSINAVKNAISNNVISEELIDKLAFRVLAWKYYKGLMYTDQK